MSLGQRIRRLRTKAGLTQLQLAELAGVARSTVTQWELGASVPRARRLEAIAAALGVGESELVYGEDHPLGEPFVPVIMSHGPGADHLPSSAEVPASLLGAHPDARAVLVADSSIDCVAPAGMLAVFDTALLPENGQLAVVEADGLGTIVRRWFRAGNTVVLVATSHDSYEDIVLPASGVVVLGTVVWVQPARPLA